MELPPQKRFTLQDIATHLGTSVHHVQEMVCDKEFEYVIEEIGGAQPPQLVYFDGTLYYQRTRKQHEHDREAKIKSLKIARANESDREALKRIAEVEQVMLDRSCGKGKACMVPEEKRGFPPSCTLTPNVYSEIHKPLCAILWSPEKPQKPYEPPNGARLFISQSSVEHFEQKHGNQTTANRVGWIESAREYAKQLLKGNKSLSLDQLAPKVYELMCLAKKEGKMGMTGRGERVPSAGTIRRHALKGIRILN